ncbi:MAG: FAD-binding oxidoreductase [Hyphomicrobiales bacterium]|nr:FAD-binding oxidoreductase [Hyphomicrobiales bacterium]MBV8443397.1 FAD-binding oxidoreductase [Hyphomicrobiales bacterium]
MVDRVNRRRLLQIVAGLPFANSLGSGLAVAASASARVRPGDPAWPSDESWDQLSRQVEGRLIKVQSPLAACVGASFDAACAQLFMELKNPFYLGDEVGLTQSLGWVGAWTSRPSVYAVAAQTTGDVVAAVNFARRHNLRLVVKGGGHSYQGSSNAADSLLIWTRQMNAIVSHDAFVGAGCEGRSEPQPAVSIGPGAIWGHVYNEVMTKAGRYVQGGGCMTVGVAGLILGGGFGSYSKAYGLAAASLIEAEVVTADGEVRIANACSNPDLFWALKGGGAGFGVVTRVTLRTHALPEYFGGVFAAIKATSDDAYRRLIAKTVEFYAQALFNSHWGEQILIGRGYVAISMAVQGLDQQQAEAVWRPFFDWVSAAPQDFAIVSAPKILAGPARARWDPSVLKRIPGVVIADDRPGAPADNIFWAGNLEEAGAVWYAYQSAWLPASLLEADRRQSLADALFAAAKPFGVSLHFNKGLAGAAAEAIAAAKDTAMNPAVTDAFALMITGALGQPAYPGVPGHEPDVAKARSEAEAVGQSMDEIRKLLPRVGSYVWETDYFQANWQDAFWGENYARLRMIKQKYDPDGLFFLHHGVGSEDWSADGFTRVEAH